ncbi:MAG TPA: head completion protein [Methylophilaceae bacterium]|jgi:hypothetical protein|nr:head completion protein [Methylophilaceae bacterium]
MSYKGKFTPKNPQKYKGNPSNIIFRSTWELRVMKYLDTNNSVIWWASEELPIPYYSPVDKKMHRYFPDFITRVKTKDGSEKTYILEVKPESQTKLREPKRKSKQFLNEAMTYAVNQAKWKAATEFCLDHNWIFKIITEKELGI